MTDSTAWRDSERRYNSICQGKFGCTLKVENSLQEKSHAAVMKRMSFKELSEKGKMPCFYVAKFMNNALCSR